MTTPSVIQIVLVFIVAFIAGIDQFSFLESLYQPIVMGPVIGAILGNFELGLIVGGTYQLITIGAMPIGGAQPPNAVIGGIMATVFACTAQTGAVDVAGAVALAIPFSILGTYCVTLLFTAMSPLMSKADKMAEAADTNGIEKINYLGMFIIGLSFAIVVTAGLVSGPTIADAINNNVPAWVMDGLSIAGNMMPFIGFSILMKVMLSGEFMGFFFAGFAMAAYVKADLLFIGFLGLAIAIFDFQISTRNKSLNAAPATDNGGDYEDGI
ncbi:MAG: PTS sugar transporter subunit IIC [Erysipelotrichaceae bacterium]